jgi:hypothetical protein
VKSEANKPFLKVFVGERGRDLLGRTDIDMEETNDRKTQA